MPDKMTYTYNVEVSLRGEVEVEAESFAVAEELTEQWLNLVSDDKRVSVFSTDGIELDSIESDDDPSGLN